MLRQAAACEELGSPFYGRLLRLAAADADDGGVVADVLADYAGRPGDDAISLRLLGSVHGLVLSGAAPALAAHYPNVGGDGDADAAWPAFVGVLRDHRSAILDGLTRAPQTNEVGRAAGLLGALKLLCDRRPLPVRLLEIGASGGLNLRVDRFRITARLPDGMVASAGPDDSPLVLEGAWAGRLPPLDATVVLVERRGCDPHPVDPTTEDGALTLMSYVWPDQAARWSRLVQAIDVARATPAAVERAGAADFLTGLAPEPGRWTVVWHSVMWQYLGEDEQRQVTAHIEAAGAAATADAPVARVSLEPYGARFLVTARTWPDLGLATGREVLADGQVVLGRAAPHGVPVRWH